MLTITFRVTVWPKGRWPWPKGRQKDDETDLGQKKERYKKMQKKKRQKSSKRKKTFQDLV
jgi:hypothetical protein